MLPLLAVLLFGNCNGGVNTFLFNMNSNGRLAKLDSLTRERQRLRAQAQQQLRGAARREQLLLIEQHANEQAQALLRNNWERRKFENRRNKIERQLRKNPVPKRPVLGPN
ncbi:hypothetical protein JAO73_06675 [Hymenobacter sp. BT523]|uniref:hypothetical protein n=1 Tax=Hymenobacter sp. BT523 TaxID=2795725 RepID=UPI0018EC28F0|nr:hypothetical protein [Hymenobacter sp. BT523]MBJ6108684.1 hypothetical protein [Hymenobacter sp. BT523]